MEQQCILKICVVDDEAATRRSIIRKLGEVDHSCTIFNLGYGEAALQELYKIKPDVVLLDIQMPGMNGLELLEKIKQSHPWIQVIMLSGFEEFSYARRALQLGAYDYLLKPVDRKQLGETLFKLKIELQMQFLQQLRPYQQQLQQEQITIDDIICCQLSLWHNEDIGKRIIWHDDETDHKVHTQHTLPSEHEQSMSQQTPRNLTLFTFRINQAIEGSVVHDYEGTFKRAEQWVDALRQAWHKRLQQQFFDIRSSSGIREQQVQPTAAALHFHSYRELAAEITQLLEQGQISALETLLRRWLEQIQSFELARVQYACAELLRQVDSSLGKGQTASGSIPEASLHYWQCWVNQHNRWSLLQHALISLLLDVCTAMKELADYEAQEQHWLDKAIAYMVQSSDMQLTLASVARHVGVHPVTLSRMFKQQTGDNFVNYLTKLRLQKAMDMLQSTKLSISDIAQAVGYTDEQHFRTLFKKKFGQSPREFRKL